MALKPMLDDPKGPSPEDLAAESDRTERARLDQELRERQAATDARLDELGRSMARNAQPITQSATPTPSPTEPNLTAEEIQKNPDQALRLLEDHIRTKAVAEAEQNVEAKYGEKFNRLSNHAVGQELENVKGRKYWGEAEKDVTRYFEDHPAELQPGRVEEVYKWFVGENVERYQEEHSARASIDTATTEMRAEANIAPASTDMPMRRSVTPEEKDKGPEPKLTEEEECVRVAYNAHGANISKKEWVEISKGKIFPKKRAVDWDAGFYKEDRHISRYEG